MLCILNVAKQLVFVFSTILIRLTVWVAFPNKISCKEGLCSLLFYGHCVGWRICEKYFFLSIAACFHFCTISGQDRKPFTELDADSGKGTMASYGSVNSLSSNSSAHNSVVCVMASDSPQQFEVLKQQKEVMEAGLEL